MHYRNGFWWLLGSNQQLWLQAGWRRPALWQWGLGWWPGPEAHEGFSLELGPVWFAAAILMWMW